MNTNSKVAEQLSLLSTLNPSSAAAGTVLTGWVSIALMHRIAAFIQTGVMGASATIDAKLRQAQDSSGAGAKDVVGYGGTKQITQIVKASGDNVAAWIECMADDLDANNGYTFVALSVTVGTAASIVGGAVFGVSRYPNAAGTNGAALVQSV